MSSSEPSGSRSLGALLEDAQAALAALEAAVEALSAAEPGRPVDPAIGETLSAVGLGAAKAAVRALAAADPGQRSDAALGEEIVALAVAGERLAAIRLRWLAVFDGRGAGAGSQGASTAGWLGWQIRQGPRQAAAQVRLARALSRRLPGTAAALSAGQISVAHAHVLAAGTEDLTEPMVTAGEPALLEAARALTPYQLRAAVTRWRAYVAPDQAEKDFTDQHERRRLHISSSIDGLVMLDGLLDAEAGNTVLTAISALAGPGGGADSRTSAQRRADALVELARHGLDTAELPDTGGERPHVNVTIDLTALQNGAGAADLDFTGPIPAARARRLACDAGVSRIITAGASQPLDVGRRTRTVPVQLRRALVARDRGCRFPGCDRPVAWCDAHHRRHWADGGPTVLSNLVLLCRLHHGMIHQGWQLACHPDGTTTATPPVDRRAKPGGAGRVSGYNPPDPPPPSDQWGGYGGAAGSDPPPPADDPMPPGDPGPPDDRDPPGDAAPPGGAAPPPPIVSDAA